jgi:hypothetical protein
MRSTSIDRRTLLKGLAAGIAVAIPLPRLGAMLNGNGTAYAAQGGALPQRFGLWFFGNGILSPRWNPTTTGTGSSWTLSEELAPLAGVKDQLSLVTGLGIKSVISDDPHVAGAAGALTGAAALLKNEVNTSIGRRVNTVQGPSIDQIIAQGITSARFRSIELGLSKCSDPDIAGTLYHNVSHNGPDAPNPPEYDPQNVFNRLFLGLSAGPDPKANLLAQAKSSVLDAVIEDARLLRPRLGVSDQSRLDQHLEGIRGLERQLQSTTSSPATPTCHPPAKPTLGPDVSRQATKARNQVMSELIALALACDLTRVFSFMLAPAAGHVYFPDVNLNHDFHDYYNHDAAQQEGVHQGVIFEMGCFADFLKQLKALPEGSGTLLDQSLIYATSDVSSGLRHDHLEFPVLMAGKAGGRLRGDVHVRASGDNYTKALVTVANLMGVTSNGIGIDAGRATDTIAGLLA